MPYATAPATDRAVTRSGKTATGGTITFARVASLKVGAIVGSLLRPAPVADRYVSLLIDNAGTTALAWVATLVPPTPLAD